MSTPREVTPVAKTPKVAKKTNVVAFRKQPPPLNVPGTVTRTGWVAPAQLSVEDWLRCGQAFDLVEGAAQWWKGDWWIEGETKENGDGEELAARAGVDYQRIRDLGSVARAYELSCRHDNLTFEHHRLAMATPDKKERLRWLKRAEENGWTTAQLRREISDWKRGINRSSLQLTASAAGLATLLYADPPWQYANSGLKGAAEEHYPTMTTAPGVPQIACFDTAFHCSQPSVAQEFALPRAIIRFSSVGTTQTEVEELGLEIRGPPLVFAVSSRVMPSHTACRQTPARTSAACSPIPPVKTRASRPPSAAASEPSSRPIRYTKRSTASLAAGAPLASSVRMSLEIPETPSMPERW